MADRDVNIKVKVDAGNASTILAGVETKIKEIGTSAQQSSGGLSSFFSSFASGGLSSLVTGLQAAVAGFSAFKLAAGVIELAKLGDDVNDAGAAFETLAAKSNMSADALIGKLGPASQGTVDNLTLMQKANKAMQAGLDPAVFDRVVAAAKRYADATGIEVTAAIDKYTQALVRQRPAQLEQLGLLKDGKIVLDGYTLAADGSALAADGLTDSLAQIQTSIKNADERLASFTDSSIFLNTVSNTLAKTWAFLRETLDLAAIGFLHIADVITKNLLSAFNAVATRAVAFGAVIDTLAHGKIPSWSKSLAAVEILTTATTKSVDGVTIALKKQAKGHDETAAATKRGTDAAEKFHEKMSELITGTKFPEWSSQIDAIATNIQQVLGNTSFGAKDLIKIFDEFHAQLVAMGVPLDVIQAGFDKVFGPQTQQNISNTAKKVKEVQGSFFGFDLGTGNSNLEKAFEEALSNAFSTALKAIASGKALHSEDWAGMASSTSGAIANALLPGSGPIVSAITEWEFSLFKHQKTAGTMARKEVAKFFEEAFNTTALQVIIDGQLVKVNEIITHGMTLFGGSTASAANGSKFFDGLGASAKAAFSGVGAAFEELLGVTGDISGQIGAMLANNIGGSLNNLQLLVESSGKSFEQLHDGVVKAFLDGKLSALEAQTALQGIAQVAQKGIPDGIGMTVKAMENLVASTAKGGRVSVDALQDIAYEAKELGIKDFPALMKNLAASGKFTSAEIQVVFDALKAHGITTIDQLTKATSEQLIPVLADLQSKKFPFKEAAKDMNDLINKVNELPATIEKKLHFSVSASVSPGDRAIIEKGVGAGVVPQSSPGR